MRSDRFAWWRLSPPLWAIMTAVAVLAFAARAHLAIHYAGLMGLHGYDDGGYYAGAAALISGRMPYADFAFLHPPGILLALSPFAALGSVTTDPAGLVAARVTFWILGAVNAALVARVAARHCRLAAAVGGLCYGLWYPAVFAERTMLLEPLGNTAVLVAVLLLGRTRRQTSSAEQLVAGAVVGLAVRVKLWMVVPLAVLVLWQLVGPGFRAAVRVVGGATLAIAVVVLPFAGHGRTLVQTVILDQLGRVSEVSISNRITGMAGLRPWSSLSGDAATVGVLAVGGCAAFAALLLTWRAGGAARWYVTLLAVNAGVLLAVAPHFDHYTTFTSVPWALVVALAAGQVGQVAGALRTWVPVATAGTVISALAVLYAPALTMDVGKPFPAGELATAVSDRPCVVSDVPMALAAMDVLYKDLKRGCPAVVDVTGPVLGSFAMRGANGRPIPRADNPRWQQHLITYLAAGSAMVVIEPEMTGINAPTMSMLNRHPVIAERGLFQVRAGTHVPVSPASAQP